MNYQLGYHYADVIRPMIQPSDLTSRSATWSTLGATADASREQLQGLHRSIGSHNSGTAIETMLSKLNSQGSTIHYLAETTRHATIISQAHAAAAAQLSATVPAMDGIATALASTVETLQRSLIPTKWLLTVLAIRSARTALQSNEDAASSAIAGFYPDSYSLDSSVPKFGAWESPDYGEASPDVEKLWATLSDEDKKKVLELLVADLATQHGWDPNDIELEFYDGPRTSGGSWNRQGTVRINENLLDTTNPINTAYHEMQHAGQTTVEREYERLSQRDIRAIKSGKQPDPFVEHGYTIYEVEAVNAEYVREPWIDYAAQSSEVQARHAGREGVENMTVEQLQHYIDQL